MDGTDLPDDRAEVVQLRARTFALEAAVRGLLSVPMNAMGVAAVGEELERALMALDGGATDRGPSLPNLPAGEAEFFTAQARSALKSLGLPTDD